MPNPLAMLVSAIASQSSSTNSMSVADRDDTNEHRSTTTTTTTTTTGNNQLTTNWSTLNSSARNSNSFLAKLTDAKKSLFGRVSNPDPVFSSADENRALLSYILSEPNPQLEIIQEFERQGAQLNAITDEGDTAIHLLARAESYFNESIPIIDYLTKKGCDPSKQNDYGWTAGKHDDVSNEIRSRNICVNICLFDMRPSSSSLCPCQSKH
jgi:ankyrin repeat protein